jgi:hypothetical protein
VDLAVRDPAFCPFVSVLNPKSSVFVLEYYCAIVLLYLKCHHTIGCCKTPLLCQARIQVFPKINSEEKNWSVSN